MKDSRNKLINAIGNLRNFLRGFKVVKVEHSVKDNESRLFYTLDFAGRSYQTAGIFHVKWGTFTTKEVEEDLVKICFQRVYIDSAMDREFIWRTILAKDPQILETAAFRVYSAMQKHLADNKEVIDQKFSQMAAEMKEKRLKDLYRQLLFFVDIDEEDVLRLLREAKVQKVLES